MKFVSLKMLSCFEMKWSRFLPKLHVYGGLLCTGFLIMVGFSGYVHQHHPKFVQHEGRKASWEQRIQTPGIEDRLLYKLAIRDSLGLFGHAPWWEDYKDSTGVSHFMIARPGKEYWVTEPVTGDLFLVDEHRTGLLNVLNQLHPLGAGMQGHGNGPGFIAVWKWVSLALGIIAIMVLCISVYYWFTRSVKKKHWWYYIIGAALIPVTLFIMIWLVG
jgi:hypothetical protein